MVWYQRMSCMILSHTMGFNWTSHGPLTMMCSRHFVCLTVRAWDSSRSPCLKSSWCRLNWRLMIVSVSVWHVGGKGASTVQLGGDDCAMTVFCMCVGRGVASFPGCFPTSFIPKPLPNDLGMRLGSILASSFLGCHHSHRKISQAFPLCIYFSNPMLKMVEVILYPLVFVQWSGWFGRTAR